MSQGVVAGLQIYPNPTDGEVTVDLTFGDGGIPLLIRVYSLPGVFIFEREVVTGDRLKLPLGDQVPGIYLLQIYVNGEWISRKIIKR